MGSVANVSPTGELFTEIRANRDSIFSPGLRLAAAVTGSTQQLSSSARATIVASSLRFEACPFSIGARVELTACATFAVNMAYGAGAGVAFPETQLVWFGSPGGTVRVTAWFAQHFGAELSVGASVPLARPSYYFDNPRVDVFTTAPVIVSASVGVPLRFP
jgi:hypothetical protein